MVFQFLKETAQDSYWVRGRAFRVKQCWWMEHHLFSLRKERERFRERSDLQDAAAAAFRKREIRRLNLRVLFSPTLRRENRGERSGVYTYIPIRLSP
nr:MAG TPA: ms48, ms51, ms56, ms59, ms60, translation, Trypanosoma, large ribosomal [Caudoviricetes sp.]